MTYTQDVEACFEGAVSGGLAQSDLDRGLEKAEGALEQIRADHESGALPLYRLPNKRDDIDACRELADYVCKDTSDLLVLGVGGSNLGAQALAQLIGFGTPGFSWNQGHPRIHFFDNLDAQTFVEALGRFNLRTTRFLAVSKSGGTAETLMQTLTAIQAIEQKGGGKYLKHHFGVIVGPGTSPMRRLAERHGFPIVEHDPNVGGRFSVLTPVGMVPALTMGLDPSEIRAGAASVLDPILSGASAADVAPAVGAALAVGLNETKGMAVSVLMPYLDRLERFAMWYRQLWAESLGKEGKGTVPIRALGPVDQHSQLQLYLAGPRDKWFTLIMGNIAGSGVALSDDVIGGDGDLEYLRGRTMGDLTDAEQRATFETLVRNGRPTRRLQVERLDSHTMNALLMHFMLETIISAHLMGVDAFDQPAVEEGKVLARQFLNEMSR